MVVTNCFMIDGQGLEMETKKDYETTSKWNSWPRHGWFNKSLGKIHFVFVLNVGNVYIIHLLSYNNKILKKEKDVPKTT